MHLLFVIAATVFLASSSGLPSDLHGIIASLSLDLDGDGSPETVVITSEKTVDGHPMDGDIVVLKEKDGELSPVWRAGRLNPWKLESGDVDGDGITEIAVGVYKKSPFDQVMARRVFIYTWNGERLCPKWLGSRLSRRFDDFVLCDINSDGLDELIALEVGKGALHRVAAYRWDVFGFEWLGCSEETAGITGLNVEDGTPFALSESGRLRVELHDDSVDLEPVEPED
jgi:hypothetical protein